MITVRAASVALAVSFSTLTGGPASDPVQDPPTELTALTLVSSAGSGCPAGAVHVGVSPDNSAFVVRYSAAYEAMAGGGVKPTDARKNCQLGVSTTAPAGYTYAISAVEFSGVASLQKASTATVKSNFYSSGTPDNLRSHTITGPYEGAWTWSNQIDPSAQVWYSCHSTRFVNISTELRVVSGSSASTSRVRFTPFEDGVSVAYRLRWMRCPQR